MILSVFLNVRNQTQNLWLGILMSWSSHVSIWIHRIFNDMIRVYLTLESMDIFIIKSFSNAFAKPDFVLDVIFLICNVFL